jgi:hypothetical protein
MVFFGMIMGHMDNLTYIMKGPFFNFFGRQMFIAFLITPIVINVVMQDQEQPFFNKSIISIYTGVGNILTCLMISSIISIFIEYPLKNMV